MSITHVVQQGEHISQIADQYQFMNYLLIWDHPSNAELKQQRANPNVLLPGDRLQIPDKTPKAIACATAKVHPFQISIPKVKLRIAVLDFDDQPLSGLDCELEVDGSKHPLQTDGAGLVECEVRRTAKKGTLRVDSLGLEMELRIGHLDPPASDTGWKARLANLGYWTASEAAAGEPERMAYALQEFQCDHGLKVTGKADEATISKLASVHGC